MPINITMPALSPTMEEGILAKWHVKEGDSVVAGDVICEIETDKATMEVEAVDEGTIGKILVADGTEGVKVNSVIAILLEEGESAADMDAAAPSAPIPAPTPPKVAPAATDKTVQPVEQKLVVASGTRTFASPLARRMAKDANIDIAALSGSGPKGRVIKLDVESAIKNGVPAQAPAKSSAALSSGLGAADVLAMYEEGTYEARPNDGMRTVVAARLTEAKQTVPHFYLTVDCNIDNLLAARAKINAAAPKDKEGKPAYKLSVNDFIVKAWGARPATSARCKCHLGRGFYSLS